MEPWQNAANQARQDAQRGMQNHLDASRRHHGAGYRPKSAIGSFVSAVLNLIGFVIALGIFGLVAFIGYFILTSK